LTGLKDLSPDRPVPARAAAFIRLLVHDGDPAVGALAATIAAKMQLADAPDTAALVRQAAADAANPALSTEARLAAVLFLAASDAQPALEHLLAAWQASTPPLRASIFDAFLSRSGRVNRLLEALETERLPLATLSAGQRTRLMERADSHQRPRLEQVLSRAHPASGTDALLPYADALQGPRDTGRGAELFRLLCASCHQVGKVGTHVGPNLSQVLQRPEETLLRDILWPSETIASGYEAYTVTTTADDEFTGILLNDTPASITLRTAAGLDQVVLRKHIARLRNSSLSLMPDGFGAVLSPADCASLLSWIGGALGSETGTVPRSQ
jgi:putative heme-binding domain-containing protein